MLRIRLIAVMVLALAVTAASATAQTFTVTGPGGGGALFVPSINPYNGTRWFVSSDMGGTFRSTNSGRTWQLIHYQQLASTAQSPPPAFFRDRMFWCSGAVLKESRDSGATWTAVPSMPWGSAAITQLASVTNASFPGVLLVGVSTGAYRSEDFGRTWTKVMTSAPKEFVVLGNKVYTFSGTNTFAVSPDAGRTWTYSQIKPGGLDLGTNAVFSVTGGSTSAQTVLFASVWNVGVIRSTDQGRTWQVVLTPYKDQNCLQMAANQTKVVYAAQTGGSWCKTLWRSMDSGLTWQSAFRMYESPANVTLSWVQSQIKWNYYITKRGFGVSSRQYNMALLTTQGEIFSTKDAGNTWQVPINSPKGVLAGDTAQRMASTGLEVTSSWGYYFDPWNSNREYIAYTDFGFTRSVDNAATWSWSASGSPWGNTFYEVAFDPSVKGKMYAAASSRHDIPHWTNVSPNDPANTSHTGGVVVSTDSGQTWARLGSGLPNLPCTSVCVGPAPASGPKPLYAGVFGSGVWKSVDSGKTWQLKSAGLGNAGNLHVYRVRVHPLTGHLYCLITGRRDGNTFSIPGGLWKSVNGGESWVDLTGQLKLLWPTAFDLDPEDDQRIYLAAATPAGAPQGGIYMTTNGGGSWSHVLTDARLATSGQASYDHTMAVRIHPEEGNVVYAGTSMHGLWYSKDSGATWSHYQAFPSASVQCVTIPPDDPDMIKVNTLGSGVWTGPYLP